MFSLSRLFPVLHASAVCCCSHAHRFGLRAWCLLTFMSVSFSHCFSASGGTQSGHVRSRLQEADRQRRQLRIPRDFGLKILTNVASPQTTTTTTAIIDKPRRKTINARARLSYTCENIIAHENNYEGIQTI